MSVCAREGPVLVGIFLHTVNLSVAVAGVSASSAVPGLLSSSVCDGEW